MAPQFSTDSIALCYSDLEAAKRWWIQTFNCKQVPVPDDWDDICVSDVALEMPGSQYGPTVLLSDRKEVQAKGLGGESPVTVPIIFCRDVRSAYLYLRDCGIPTGTIQKEGDTQFFEMRDPEGTVIEICSEL